jgi:bile acid:Na+ symporter, BASS family
MAPVEADGPIGRFVQGNLLWLLLGTYAAAALLPGPGRWLRDVTFSEIGLLGERTRLTLPMALLALLLFNAGLGVSAARLRGLLRAPQHLAAGVAATLAVPLALLFAAAGLVRLWHDPAEAEAVVLGLAIVAAMPVAGSSVAWTRTADGDLALGLGLVLCSTALSPLITPTSLRAAGLVAPGDAAVELRAAAGNGTGPLLAACVALPAALGVLLRAAAGSALVTAAEPCLKLANVALLLLLIYANTATALSKAVDRPDVDFLILIVVLTAGFCAACFAAGWWLGRLLGADRDRRAALTFGLGMNNNGAGLVLATVALPGRPEALLPVIAYNLIQHLAAGLVEVRLRRSAGEGHEGGTR